MPGRPGWVAGTEFRPGIIPLRPLLLGDLYGGVIKAIRGNLAATMGLALLVCLVTIVPMTAVGAWLGSRVSLTLDDSGAVDETFLASDGLGFLGTYLPTLGVMIASLFLVGFMAYVIGQAALGRKVTANETWDGSRRAVPRILGVTLLVSLVIVGALLVTLALPALWLIVGQPRGAELVAAIIVMVLAVLVAIALTAFLMTRLALVTPPIVLEGLPVTAAIRRSWLLTRRGFWRILGIRLLTSLVVGVIAQVLAFPISLIGVFAVLGTGNEAQLLAWQAVISGVTGLITATLTTPFSAGVDALLYLDQRIRLEGLDVQLISVAQGSAAPPWPSAAR